MKIPALIISKRDYILPSLAFLVTFAIFAPFARLGVDPHHDGLMLKTALDILSGQAIFRETFTQYGALTAYLQAGFLKILGPTLLNLKLATVIIYSTASLLFFLANRTFLPRRTAVLAFFLWLSFAPFFHPGWALLPWSSVFAMLFQAIALVLLVKSLNSPKMPVFALFAGVDAALTVWCRVPVGLTLFFALNICYTALTYLAQKEIPPPPQWKPLASCILGFIGTNLIFFGVLAMNHAIRDAYIQIVIIPRFWVNTVAEGGLRRLCLSLFIGWKQALLFLSLLILSFAPITFDSELIRMKCKNRWPISVLYYSALLWVFVHFQKTYPEWMAIDGAWASTIPIVLLVGGGALFFKKLRIPQISPDQKTIAAFCSIIVALSSWAQYYPVHCYRHLFWGITPGIGPFIFLAFNAAKKRFIPFFAIFTVISIPIFSSTLKTAKEKLGGQYTTLNRPDVLKGMRVEPNNFELLDQGAKIIETYLRATPSTPLLLEGSDALFLTYAHNLTNPGPLFVAWHLPIPELGDLKQARHVFIRENRPLIIFQDRAEDVVQAFASTFKYVPFGNIKNFVFLIPSEWK